jgi:hypothetical protein
MNNHTPLVISRNEKNKQLTIIKPRVVDPDPDPYSEYGSGSRRAKMTHKSRQYFVKVHVLKCWMASFEN